MQIAPGRVSVGVLWTMCTLLWVHLAYYFLGAYFHWGSRRQRRWVENLRREAEGTTDGSTVGESRNGEVKAVAKSSLSKSLLRYAVNRSEGWDKLLWQLPLGMNWIIQILWALRESSNLVPERAISFFSHILLLGHFWHGSGPFMG